MEHEFIMDKKTEEGEFCLLILEDQQIPVH